MNVKMVCIFYDNQGFFKSSSSDVLVPGIGKVSIENGVSKETAEAIGVEVAGALRATLRIALPPVGGN